MPVCKRNFRIHAAVDATLSKRIWDRLPHRGDFWGYYAGTTEAGFTRLLASSDVLVELPFGIIRLTDYMPRKSVEAHGVFWSREALRSTSVYAEVIQWIHDILKIPLIHVVVPMKSERLKALLVGLGFSRLRDIPGHYRTVRGCFDGVLYARMS